MTTNRGQGVLAAAPPVRLSRRISPNGHAESGATRLALPQPHVAAWPYPGQRLARAVTPYREERCLSMPRYARPGRA